MTVGPFPVALRPLGFPEVGERARSEADLRLYFRLGYEERAREVLRPGVELVHLVTSLPGTQR